MRVSEGRSQTGNGDDSPSLKTSFGRKTALYGEFELATAPPGDDCQNRGGVRVGEERRFEGCEEQEHDARRTHIKVVRPASDSEAMTDPYDLY